MGRGLRSHHDGPRASRVQRAAYAFHRTVQDRLFGMAVFSNVSLRLSWIVEWIGVCFRFLM